MHSTVAYAFGSDPLPPAERSNVTFLSESFRHLHNIYGGFDVDRRDKLTIERLWPTDADLVEVLNALTTGNITAQAYSFHPHSIRRGIPTERIITALSRLADTNGSYAGLQVLCHVLEVVGERSHFALIEGYVLTEPVPAATISQLKLNTHYEIRRRSLH